MSPNSSESGIETFPSPSPSAREHSDKLTAQIRAEIDREGGSIGFTRFMELALYSPGLGYYSAGSRKFGGEGDFVTAPELGPLFARCLARWLVNRTPESGPLDILEIGAGSGELAVELLAELDRLGRPLNRYCILEVSAELRARQQQALRRNERVCWLDTWPDSFNGIVLANEVVDALPVERFEIGPEGPCGLGVCWRDGGFRELRLPAGKALLQRVAEIEACVGTSLPVGFRSEYCPMLEAWMRSLSAALERGIVLLADYGLPRSELYHRDRGQGTLRCHYRHRAHDDPFVLVGLQDITAWVDFTALADAGIDAGLELEGFVTQAHFLLGAGMTDVLAAEAGSGQFGLREQAKQLVLPGEMGERFKMMVFSRDWPADRTEPGIHDMRHRL